MPALQVSVPIAYELLAQCIKQGQALVQRASLVGDFSDYESWKAARNQWIDPTVQALEHMYGGPSQRGEFTQAVTAADTPQRWQQQYAGDLDAVKAAIELLTVLQSELAFVREGTALEAGDAQVTPPEPQSAAPEGDADPDRLAPPADEASPVAPLLAREHEDSHGDLRPQRENDLAEPSVGAELAPAPSFARELAHQADGEVSAERAGAAAPANGKQVLLAHGRNERWMAAVARLLEQAGTHEVTILNERPGDRDALAQQFSGHTPSSRYAVVLLTADDIGAPRVESEDEPYYSPRPHQAVVFEMGFLVAALEPGRVCVLYEEGVQLPCDLQDVAYVRLDMAGTWQPKLLLQLRKAGFDYDLNKLAAA
ncbi:MAG TPA: nucleotide-binding protein [Solirubrobacteraceae bacterium]|nr:nucleotide-binding protein [Solirubrobacteraceae bacterium]